MSSCLNYELQWEGLNEPGGSHSDDLGKVVFVLIRTCNVHCNLCVCILLLRAPPEIMGQRLLDSFGPQKVEMVFWSSTYLSNCFAQNETLS